MNCKTNWTNVDYLNITDYQRIYNNFLEMYKCVYKKDYDGETIPVPVTNDYYNKVPIQFFRIISKELQLILTTLEDKNKIYIDLITNTYEWLDRNVLDYIVMNDIERAMQLIYDFFSNPDNNIIYDYCFELYDFNEIIQTGVTEIL